MALKPSYVWKLALTLQSTNPKDHLSLVAALVMEYVLHDSHEYSTVATAIIKEVLSTLYQYGAKGNVSMRR